MLGVPIILNLPAVAVVMGITAILVKGVKESTTFNNIMVGFKLLVLALFVAVGIYYFDPKNWVPFAPGGWKGIQVGAATIFFAYIGFDAVSTVAEETKNPQKDMTYDPGSTFAVRGGYLFNRSDENFTLGFGTIQGSWGFDYALGGSSNLGSRHQMTLSYHFAAPSDDDEVQLPSISVAQ